MSSTFRKLSLLLTSLFYLLILSDAFALEMSSKRDCAVCHVMWLDDFRTDKETLIKWQPGEVIIKGAQDVVSSEEICYSCHDGYVQDSRYSVWKYNRHKINVKPSKNVIIPEELPLNVRDEIYCGTCHSAHGTGAAPTDASGLTSVLRFPNINSGMCKMCHRNETAYKSSNGHPIDIATIKLPDELFKLGSKKSTDKDRVICESCHKIHGAKGDKILVINNKNSELCTACHEKQKNLAETKHDLRQTLPEEKNIKQQTATEAGPCSACHTPHNSSGKRLWARRLGAGNPASQMCLTCHAEDSAYKTKRIGKYSHAVNVEPISKEKIPTDLPLFMEDGSKDPNGKIQCFTCHDIHQWDPQSPANRGGKDVEGDASNSFLRVSNSTSSNLCLRCHTDKRQLVTSDHNLEITAPDEKNAHGFTPNFSGPCGTCHIPHNAEGELIWAKKLSDEKNMAVELCIGCHNKNGPANTKVIGDYSHPVNVTLEKFNITIILPLYDSNGKKIQNGEIVCLTCHDPHIWNPNKESFNPLPNYTYKNIEGDAENSFLRKANSPQSDLCKTCHADKTYVEGTDHDLNVTSPDARNFLGQTVKESGVCGVCHIVHNGPNKLKLWARVYGPTGPDESNMNALCNSCHSKGNPAEKKVPPIATHPEEKLINNIMRSNRTAIDYTPIYDKNGKEINVGNISCPSCHNAHQWGPLAKQKGIGKNLEGSAINSFLRTVSYNNICIDCHGLDALFRYKYFHNPKERVGEVRPLRPGGK